MSATDPQSLFSDSNVNCYNNYSAQFDLLKLSLLQIIANSLAPMAATDPQSLLSDANVACYRSYGSWPLLELALLQLIAKNIGAGTGGTANLTGTVNPNGSVTPTAVGQFYTNTANDTLWQATTLSITGWLQWI